MKALAFVLAFAIATPVFAYQQTPSKDITAVSKKKKKKKKKHTASVVLSQETLV